LRLAGAGGDDSTLEIDRAGAALGVATGDKAGVREMSMVEW
jgi:hypothetical protein